MKMIMFAGYHLLSGDIEQVKQTMRKHENKESDVVKEYTMMCATILVTSARINCMQYSYNTNKP